VAGTVNGCFDTTSVNITVNPLPSITASANTLICNGDAAVLTATSSSGNYLWGPLVGLSCYTCDTVIASPTENTTYVVTTVNSFNCRKTDTVFVTVIQPFTMTISEKDTICIGDSVVLSAGGAPNYTWTPSSTLSCSDCANPIATPEYTTQYFVIGYDDYNCFSYRDSVEIAVGQYPVVTIDPIPPLSTGTIYPITSNITNGPIRTFQWRPPTYLDCDDCETPKATIKRDICYSLEAENIYGCAGSDTICIKAFCENVQTFIPNAFTPDRDGINDIFMVRAKGINTVKSFKIYNRWGQIVFERSNFPPNNPAYGWDGKIKGTIATADVFAYTAEVLCENNVSYVYKGNVTLIR
jgi:gliding motility-associated-like protein